MLSIRLLTLLAALLPPTLGETARPEDPPCTATSHQTGNFVDLRPLRKIGENRDWVSRGWDYGANFTVNICAPVVAGSSRAFVGVDEEVRGNVSAYYEKDGEMYSIGTVQQDLKFRGRQLVLEYKGGSPCPGKTDYRKSMIMSFLCDQDISSEAAISFTGQLNECSYFFQVRTLWACPTIQETDVSPLAIFGIIGGVAVVVYLLGGCMYQRTVMHQRGWRQIPHYQTWSKLLGIVWGLIAGIGSTIVRILPLPARFKRSRISQQPRPVRGVGSNRAQYSDDVENENRLLDALDDEWGSEF